MDSNKDKILITGAGGWLGSELTEKLLAKGNHVIAINNIYTDRLKELKEEYKDDLNVVIGDICDKKIIQDNIADVKKVFHLAARVHFIPTNKKEEEDFYLINTKASEDIFKLCTENKVERVIFFSTVSVYEKSDNKISIDSPKNPTTIYGKSKLQAEQIANKMYKEDKLPITIIEPVTVYGEGDVGNFKKLENIINKGFCIRIGNGKNKKTVIYYKDLINNVINISNDDTFVGKTVICGTEVLSINEINNILIKKSQKKVFKFFVPKFIAKITTKICCFSVLKKIKRKIEPLMQNSEFEIYNDLKEYTKFEEFELRGK